MYFECYEPFWHSTWILDRSVLVCGQIVLLILFMLGFEKDISVHFIHYFCSESVDTIILVLFRISFINISFLTKVPFEEAKRSLPCYILIVNSVNFSLLLIYLKHIDIFGLIKSVWCRNRNLTIIICLSVRLNENDLCKIFHKDVI